MKKWIVLLIVLLASPAWSAPFLVCDFPPTDVEAVDVRADGVIIRGDFIAHSDGVSLILLDVENAAVGPHNYNARWIWSDESGWPGPGEWSSTPLSVTKPGESPTNFGVRRVN